MNRFWNVCLTAGIMCGLSAQVLAQTHSVYFNQQGKITATMSAVSYVRQYQVHEGVAQVQDFYYPSMKKYSDPYQVSAEQIKAFVPVLNNGTLTLWHFNGQKKMVGTYRNGKPDGEWTNWYPNGKKSAVMPYVNGMSDGTGSRYYRNGTKESEVQFKHNKANGHWKQWYENGQPKTDMVMVNDRPVKIVSWDENGRLLSEMTVSNGRRNGVVLDWYEDGSKKSEAVYSNDQLVKKTYWDENGFEVE